MRLIDAEKLPRQKQLEAMGNGEYIEVEIVRGVDIDNAPTIEAEEVTHGRWIVEKVPYSKQLTKFTCSECGDDFETVSEVAKKISYCRSCGAKMDGGRDE